MFVDVSEFIDDDLFIDHLDVTASETVDELASFLLSLACCRFVLSIDLLVICVDGLSITDESDSIPKGSVCYWIRERLNIAHIDESSRVFLQVSIDPITERKSLVIIQFFGEADGNIHIGCVTCRASGMGSKQNRELNARLGEVLTDSLNAHGFDGWLTRMCHTNELGLLSNTLPPFSGYLSRITIHDRSCTTLLLVPAVVVAQGNMPPVAPSSLPAYLAEGLPKQDDEALHEAREYIDELLAAREQRRQEPVTEDDLPENAHLLENESSSAVYLEHRTCGDTTCSCMSGGEKHGPYKYRAYRDGDTVRREYLGKAKNDE